MTNRGNAALVPPGPAPVADPSFAAIVEAHVDWVHRTLRRLGVRGPDVDDLTQEVFLVFVRRKEAFDPKRPLRPWLFGIAYRVALDHARRAVRELPEPRLDELAYDEQALEHRERDQARQILFAALERVPVERRAVLVAYELDGTGMADIARSLGIPLFTAYSRLRKARRELAIAVREMELDGAPDRGGKA